MSDLDPFEETEMDRPPEWVDLVLLTLAFALVFIAILYYIAL